VNSIARGVTLAIVLPFLLKLPDHRKIIGLMDFDWLFQGRAEGFSDTNFHLKGRQNVAVVCGEKGRNLMFLCKIEPNGPSMDSGKIRQKENSVQS